jgi:hypothetical protein
MVHQLAMNRSELIRLDEQEPEDVGQHRDTELRKAVADK